VITPEQVADLQPGDVVEYHRSDWPEGVVIRGPLHPALNGAPWIGLGDCAVRFDSGNINGYSTHEETTLTVVSRAPRPLYVNHPRTEPVPGDVMVPVSHSADDLATWSWCPLRSGAYRWRDTQSDAWLAAEDIVDDLRLLVDGSTGEVVQ
jgi:hypothetical protein